MKATARQVMIRALSVPIWVYRLCISPLLPPTCRFAPTCSEYALEALRIHGPIRGTGLAIRRIAKCHPIKILGGSSGFDPVPPISNNKDAVCGCPGHAHHATQTLNKIK